MELTKALDGIWASQLPLAERRREAARAVVFQMSGGQGGGRSGSSDDGDERHGTSIVTLAEVLAEVGVGRGQPLGTTTVSEAKAWLRQQGDQGIALAKRLGKLSKHRNAAAHPDGGLLLAVRSLALQHGQLSKNGGDKLQLEELGRSQSEGFAMLQAKQQLLGEKAVDSLECKRALQGVTPSDKEVQTDTTPLPAEAAVSALQDECEECELDKANNSYSGHVGIIRYDLFAGEPDLADAATQTVEESNVSPVARCRASGGRTEAFRQSSTGSRLVRSRCLN